MAISRAQKEAQIAELKDEFSRSEMTVLTSFSGLSVADSQELRARMRDAGGSFRVVKNAMLTHAAAEYFDDVDLSDVEGPIAVAFGYDDLVAPAKTLVDFGKDREGIEPVAAINAKGHRFSADEVSALANLPSREQLQGQLVGTIAAPLTGLVNTLSGNLRGLVTALDGIAQAKE